MRAHPWVITSVALWCLMPAPPLSVPAVAGVRIRMTSSGRAGAMTEALDHAVPERRAEGPRLEHRPGIVEWWRPAVGGWEHGVTFARRPGGDGPLVLELDVAGATPAARDDGAIELRRGRRAVASYGGLVALDARGRRARAHMTVEGGRIRVEVDDRDAVYPLVVDPMLVASAPATLVASDGAAGDGFGRAVSIDASATRIVVGAPLDDTAAGADAGSVRVFSRSGTVWTEEATLLRGSAAAGDRLGTAVAISADGLRVIAGAPAAASIVGPDAGLAVVYRRAGTIWEEEASFPGNHDSAFGTSVAMSGDGSRAFGGGPERPAEGDIRWFQRTGTTWLAEAGFTVPPSGGSHGTSLSISADGLRVAVGGRTTPTSRVWVLAGATWNIEGSYTAALGYAVNLALSADGGVLVGADPAGSTSGVAATMRRTGATWAFDAVLGAGSGTRFGASVAVDADGDRIFVGQPDPSSARVRVFVDAGTGPTADISLVAPPGGPSGLGQSLAVSADGSVVVAGTAGDAVLVYTLSPAAPNGAPCVSDVECLSTFCTDGVCCETACRTGLANCVACSAARTGGADGVCAPRSAGSECRAVAGVCDVAEVCDGVAMTCPVDAFAPSGTACRAVADVCDAAESCSGTSADCPADAFLTGVECRATRGACDLAEVCFGTSAACPPDGLVSSGVSCRASVDTDCDPEEACDGATTACPADVNTCGAADAGGDAAPATDAGGMAPAATAGCGCRARGGDASAVTLLFSVAVVVVMRRRRPPSRRIHGM